MPMEGTISDLFKTGATQRVDQERSATPSIRIVAKVFMFKLQKEKLTPDEMCIFFRFQKIMATKMEFLSKHHADISSGHLQYSYRENNQNKHMLASLPLH